MNRGIHTRTSKLLVLLAVSLGGSFLPAFVRAQEFNPQYADRVPVPPADAVTTTPREAYTPYVQGEQHPNGDSPLQRLPPLDIPDASYASNSFLQQQPGAPPNADDRLTSLEIRLEALEQENAALRSQFGTSGSGVGTAWPEECPPDEGGGWKKTLPKGLGTYYENGFVLVDTPDPEKVPFKLTLNLFNQFRFLNQELDSKTFTDHLGTVYPVDSRNDFNMNRNLYYFGGYVYDPKMIYNIIIWSSNSVATVIQGGYLGYQFDKCFTLYGGYWGIPGSRSNTRDFMFLEGVDRSMADSFFRPGFTQGIWAEGEPVDQLYYVAYIGNSANTLNVSTSKIDKNLIYSTSTWWEPLGDYGPPGAARNAFSDLEYHENVVVRLGTSFSGSREDRFSASGAGNPENVALYNSDGVLTFATGAFAPGVTMQYVNFYMWAQDFGVKYRGLAFNAQHFMRWLNNFKADGPLPLDETYDHGFEASLSYFICPKTFELYGRGGVVNGQFRDSNEYAVGFNWHPWQNRGFRLIGEANHVDKSPTSSIQTIYNAGMVGWNYCLQTQLYF